MASTDLLRESRNVISWTTTMKEQKIWKMLDFHARHDSKAIRCCANSGRKNRTNRFIFDMHGRHRYTISLDKANNCC
jgi:hypothetical protein